MSDEMIPIFIITCDRLEVLKTSIQSYRNYIKTPFEVVIIDFGSTWKPTIEYLRQLEREKVKVFWEEKIVTQRNLNRVYHSIQVYFENHKKSNYIVTDPDVALDNVDGDILDVYSFLLEEIPEIDVVGTMLRIDDIPSIYRNRNEVFARHREKFWEQEVSNIQYGGKKIEYIFGPIDSTFGMTRANDLWRRMKNGIRTLAPYSARHLDWYIDLDNPTPDQQYYIENASKRLANWNILRAK